MIVLRYCFSVLPLWKVFYGLPQVILKALDWCIKAVELGSPEACSAIGSCYTYMYSKGFFERIRKGPICLTDLT